HYTHTYCTLSLLLPTLLQHLRYTLFPYTTLFRSPQRNIEKWIRETPKNFRFVVKIHQALTGHADAKEFAEDKKELFNLFKDSMRPLKASGKLAMILVQFPPWFDLQTQNINYLRYVREQLK